MWIARGRPNRALSSRFGKHKYGFHGGRGPSAFALATGPLAPVPGDPHRKKEKPK